MLVDIDDDRTIVDDAIVGRHPAGYVLRWPFRRRKSWRVQFPGAKYTAVTAVNDGGTAIGFYAARNGRVFGFVEKDGLWTSYVKERPLGINGAGDVVGYFERNGVHYALGPHGPIVVPGAVASEATGINERGDVVGWMKTAGGTTTSFLFSGSAYTALAYPHATATQAYAINRQGLIVGAFIDSAGLTHGFILANAMRQPSWSQFDDPKSTGETALRGINRHQDLVGWYVDQTGRTTGFYCV